MNEINKVIQNHRSIRSYKDVDIDEEIINDILKSAQSMPSSINGQQISVIVIKNKETKKTIAKLAGNQKWIEECSVFMVFVMDFYKTNLGGEKNGTPQVIHESTEGSTVGVFDAGIAMGATIIAAESYGLGIVPIGGIRNNPEEMINLLSLPEFTFPIAGLALGYPEGESKKKPRLPFNTFKHEETYNKEILKEEIDKYDDLMKYYLKGIGREQEGNWSQLTSSIYKSVYFPKVYPTMIKQGFKNNK